MSILEIKPVLPLVEVVSLVATCDVVGVELELALWIIVRSLPDVVGGALVASSMKMKYLLKYM